RRYEPLSAGSRARPFSRPLHVPQLVHAARGANAARRGAVAHMATARRRPSPRLSDVLVDEAHRFGFFQAVRLLHLFEPKGPGVGGSGPPRQEPVRFTAEPSLTFPACEIREMQPGEGTAPPVMTVRFMGLFGPQGTLPRHYTDLVIDRLRRKDGTLAAFLNL